MALSLSEIINLALIRPEETSTEVEPLDPADVFDPNPQPIILPDYSSRQRRRRGVQVASRRRPSAGTGIRRYVV